jgi:hypothetical protein
MTLENLTLKCHGFTFGKRFGSGTRTQVQDVLVGRFGNENTRCPSQTHESASLAVRSRCSPFTEHPKAERNVQLMLAFSLRRGDN